MSKLFRLVLLCLITSNLVAANYFVDPSGDCGAIGDSGHPWQTIQYAANTVLPGETINIHYRICFEVLIANSRLTNPNNDANSIIN